MKWLYQTALILFLLGALHAEGASEIERQIVGTWKQASPTTDKSEWDITYDASGSYRVSMLFDGGDCYWISGSWRLEGSVVVMSATDASDRVLCGVPHTLKFTIQRLEGDELDFDFWPDLRFPKKYIRKMVNQRPQGTPGKEPSSSTEPEARRP